MRGNMLTLKQIQERLKDRKIVTIHEATDIPEITITRIRDGITTNPTYSTLETLSEYFEKQEKDFGLIKQG